MNWTEIISAIATGALGSGLVELLKRWGASPDPAGLVNLDPTNVQHLCKDREYCRLALTIHAELGMFIEQLSLIYCELIGLSGGTDETIDIADPSQGRSVFVPYAVEYFWRSFYQHKISLRKLENRLDSLQPSHRQLVTQFLSFRSSVNPDSILATSQRIHKLLTQVLGYSKESSALFDSAGEAVYVLTTKTRPAGHQSKPVLLDDTGEELRFYTIWQSNRFIATDQALQLLTKHSGGSFKRRLSKADLVRANYLILSVFSITGLLFETASEVVRFLSYQDGSLISEVRKEVAPHYDHLLTLQL
ncbi:MAG: hypothetical protein MN733_28605 [Nitrososphaera sp.]|nr:hypothetical protein [Nitrososphaera sp.]